MTARHHFPASDDLLSASHYYIIAPDHRIGTYDWPTAVSEYAAMLGTGVRASVVQTLRNRVQIDVTAEALRDWLGGDDPMPEDDEEADAEAADRLMMAGWA